MRFTSLCRIRKRLKINGGKKQWIKKWISIFTLRFLVRWKFQIRWNGVFLCAMTVCGKTANKIDIVDFNKREAFRKKLQNSASIGKALYPNELFVLCVDYSSIGGEAKHIDAFAVGDVAKWILEQNITRGSVFEANFRLTWKYVRNIAGKSRLQIGASDAYVAKLIMEDKDVAVISQNANTASTLKKENDTSIDEWQTILDGESGGRLSQEDIFRILQNIT